MRGWRARFEPDSPQTVRTAMIGFGLLTVVGVGFWLVGRTDRVTLIATRPDAYETVLLMTEPSARYVMPRNLALDLKAGCRYDLNYPPIFGKLRPERSTYQVRRATLVDCPSR